MSPHKGGLPPMPERIQRRPVNKNGYPVPWFATWIDGEPDFRVITSEKIAAAHVRKLCWVCGEPRGSFLAFAIGPMCAVNRTTSEPPSHRECAVWSAMACPFLTKPKVTRRENEIAPLDENHAAGFPIARNPGAVAVWITKSYQPFRADAGGRGVLFRVGDPVEVLWFAEGRRARREEIEHSIDTGLPLLMELAVPDGPRAVMELELMVATARQYLPASEQAGA